MREIKTPEWRASLKSVSFSGFGEKKLYIENIPGGVFYFKEKAFSIWNNPPRLLHRKTSVGEDSQSKTIRMERFLYRKPPRGVLAFGDAFLYGTGHPTPWAAIGFSSPSLPQHGNGDVRSKGEVPRDVKDVFNILAIIRDYIDPCIL